MRHLLYILFFAMLPLSGMADNWDHIRNSGEYYYGQGHGKNITEATERARVQLLNMIATNVSSEFTELVDQTTSNNSSEYKSRVTNCIRTYAQASLSNVDCWAEGEEPNVVVKMYIKRSEVYRIYEGRINRAKHLIEMADQALKKRHINDALKYYYWAYSLVRSVQRPNEVKDDKNQILIDWLPNRIEEILRNIDIRYVGRNGDFVNFEFLYENKAVSGLDYSYLDGRSYEPGSAKDGYGTLEMIKGYQTDTYHINVEYEYKNKAGGDSEMQSVLNVIPRKVMDGAAKKVPRKSTGKVQSDIIPTGINLTPRETQLVSSNALYQTAISKIVEAIKTNRHTGIKQLFTPEGYEIYNELIRYGKARIVGKPKLKFFKGANGGVVARGLQMSFSFRTSLIKTFVEDVVFAFNDEQRICNVAFGLGQIAENDILCRNAPGWKDETRELIMEFLEKYKTAYSLKRLDYIREIFADDAKIIVGYVPRPNLTKPKSDVPISRKGKQLMKRNQMDKETYLARLEKCFKNNEFINLSFSNTDVQWLEKYKNDESRKETFGIQIGQEYSSSSYADMGYLFLLVNLTNHDMPLIEVRTWQPNEFDMSKVYNAGDFWE